MRKRQWTAQEIEYAIAQHFSWRRNIIVPNVSWGFGLRHEADMLILTPAGNLWEVEIKISKSDLKRDHLKGHNHSSELISRLYFALPETLKKHSCLVPEGAGILSVEDNGCIGGRVKILRPPKNRRGRALKDFEVNSFLRLGVMRIWTLKEHLIRMRLWKKEQQKWSRSEVVNEAR